MVASSTALRHMELFVVLLSVKYETRMLLRK